jgi:hypothetical protein
MDTCHIVVGSFDVQQGEAMRDSNNGIVRCDTLATIPRLHGLCDVLFSSYYSTGVVYV